MIKPPAESPIRRPAIWSWAMYDWANSAFATTIMAAMLPPFYAGLARADGLEPAQATAAFGITAAASLFIVALLGPVLGAIADHTGGKKKYLGAFLAMGIAGTALLATLGGDNWRLASAFFILGNIGFAGGNVFYESLLPHISRDDADMDRISTLGYALGYLGGGILLAINVLLVTKFEWFGLPGQVASIKLSFLSVAFWWGLFALPLFFRVEEPAVRRRDDAPASPIAAGIRRLAYTFRNIRRYRQLFIFLIAFWIYNDGIGTIIKMATVYGSEIGIEMTDLIKALLITQFIGFPAALAFAPLARLVTAKNAIMIGLATYAVISVLGYFMKDSTHFYMLAAMVGLVQGGTQALSRSLFGSMTPRHFSSEFFGFLSTSSKFAGIFGPLIIAGIGLLIGSSRLGILALVAFFVVGAGLLAMVDVDEGRRIAREDEALYDQ